MSSENELQNKFKLAYLAERMMRERMPGMNDVKENVNFEEVLDSEIDDIWDIFFPYIAEKADNENKTVTDSKGKQRKLRFLSM